MSRPDNFMFMYTGETVDDLVKALEFIVTDAISGYHIDENGITLYSESYEDVDMFRTIFGDTLIIPKSKLKLLAESIMSEYLNKCELKEPGIDGTCKRGFIISVPDFTSRIPDKFAAVVTIRATWLMYGK